MFRSRAVASISAALLAGLLSLPAAHAADAPSCKTVRMSDPGWADITSTNAMFGIVLDGLGYKQKVDTLSVPVTFESLKNNQLDVFLGNWMPVQDKFVKPMTEAGTLVVVKKNLEGIRFTLAVPDYVPATVKGLEHLRFDGHDVLAFQVLDHDEVDFPLAGLCAFEGLEGGRRVLTDAARVRSAYRGALNAFLEELMAGCVRAQVDHVLASTAESLDKVLSAYLLARSGGR